MNAVRSLYSLLWNAAAPLAPLRLAWRGRREPGYRESIGERYGRYRDVPPPRVLWVHAVSLGETRAAAPLVERLRLAYPDVRILITHMTATGRAAGRDLFGDSVVQAWLPYDAPFAVRRFLSHFMPCAGLLMETELWPNVVALAREARVPLYLVNARMSAKSARLYAAFPALTRPMFGALSGVAAQTDADAARLAALGAPQPVITGNLKFDAAPATNAEPLGRELKRRFGETRPTWVAASTRDGEEAMIVDALAARPLPARTLTVIVPRHPQRFAAVADLLRQRAIPFVRRTENALVTAEIAVVLGDSIGEMAGYFGAADVAFVGGSLVPLGGQNLIEPIGLGVPTVVGPHMFNFADAAAKALAAGAAVEVADARALVATVAALLDDAPRRKAMHDAALAFHAAHRGAADRLIAWLAPRLDAAIAARTEDAAGNAPENAREDAPNDGQRAVSP
jgi:3-deoxy-D-manno-octulosonic-acid transferase